jgi:hypothetical protein
VPPAPAPTVSISANPGTIVQNQSSILSWTSANATSAQIDNGIGAVSSDGTSQVKPLQTTTYTITVTGHGGTTSAHTTVLVNPAPPVVSAGADQTITLPAMAMLNGQASDPNSSGNLQLLWTESSGPGTVAFADPTSAATTAGFSAAGTYVLQLTATDTVDHLSGSATVNITVNPPLASDFTIVALPDTQYYSAGLYGGTAAMFNAQTAWIVSNQASRNIAYVVHLGDIVQDGDQVPAEWGNATVALGALETAGIPYGVAVGNHDQTPEGNPGGTSLFNHFFGVSRFTGRSYYGGHFGTDNNNHFDLFSAGGLDFIVVYMEYDMSPNPDVLAWARQLLQTYSTRRAIVVSHYILNGGLNASFSTQGQAIYDALKDSPNLFLMLCGHVTLITEGRRQDTFNGHTVYSLMSDYQSVTNGGDGWLRIMRFSPANNRIDVSTYSPVLGQFENTMGGQFSLSYNMQNGPVATKSTRAISATLASNGAPSTQHVSTCNLCKQHSSGLR